MVYTGQFYRSWQKQVSARVCQTY